MQAFNFSHLAFSLWQQMYVDFIQQKKVIKKWELDFEITLINFLSKNTLLNALIWSQISFMDIVFRCPFSLDLNFILLQPDRRLWRGSIKQFMVFEIDK